MKTQLATEPMQTLARNGFVDGMKQASLIVKVLIWVVETLAVAMRVVAIALLAVNNLDNN